MNDFNAVTAADLATKAAMLPLTTAEELPFRFLCGTRRISGIPTDFCPTTRFCIEDSSLRVTTVEGTNAQGLRICAEVREYLDFPVQEWLVTLTNDGNNDTPMISDLQLGGVLRGGAPTLYHGNGDTCKDDGYDFVTEAITAPLCLSPDDGTSCHGAFPYMRLMLDGWGVDLAIGWPAMWQAAFTPTGDGVRVDVGQKRLHTILHPGETLRSPRLTLLGFCGDAARGCNLWRRWYIAHILPKENGQPLGSQFVLHTPRIGGYDEFAGVTVENQIAAIDGYLRRGLHPDIWWIDAGWYDCGYDWPKTGNWYPNPETLPRGLGEVGAYCKQHGIKLLLWFEPERVRDETQWAADFQPYLLHRRLKDGSFSTQSLLNLGVKACCDAVIERIDALIEQFDVAFYRQDFNIQFPILYWEENEAEDRIGAIENLHVQGYLRLWDTLLRRHPGLLIDSCASGGRRNDMETMRRAVPLHYTDVGYGIHPIKQKQYREMLEWIPYFRSHIENWDDATGQYGAYGTVRASSGDAFSWHCAMAPAVAAVIPPDGAEEQFEIARTMLPIWRKAAKLMQTGDYYPLTDCRKDAAMYYAAQFDDPNSGRGYVQIIRNVRVKEDSFTCFPFAQKDARYRFTDAARGITREIDGETLCRDGFTDTLPPRSGRIWFYTVTEK